MIDSYIGALLRCLFTTLKACGVAIFMEGSCYSATPIIPPPTNPPSSRCLSKHSWCFLKDRQTDAVSRWSGVLTGPFPVWKRGTDFSSPFLFWGWIPCQGSLTCSCSSYLLKSDPNVQLHKSFFKSIPCAGVSLDCLWGGHCLSFHPPSVLSPK